MNDRFNIGVINIAEESVQQAARDTADERLTASKEEMKNMGLVGRMVRRFWKEGIAKNVYRNREIAKARREIDESRNLYSGQGTDPDRAKAANRDEMGAIVQRFVQEYDEFNETLVDSERGEQRAEMGDTEAESRFKNEIKELIKRFAHDTTFDPDDFEAEKQTILDECFIEREDRPDVFSKSRIYADNISQIARQIRALYLEGEDLDELIGRIDFIEGKAKTGLKTEACQTRFDRLVEWASRSKIGQLVGPEVAAAAVATAGVVVNSVIRGGITTAAKVAFFGGAPVVGGVVGYVKERHEVTRERSFYQREMASGRRLTPESPRREKLEQFQYDMQPAVELAAQLEQAILNLNNPDVSEHDVQVLMDRLVEVEARSRLSSGRGSNSRKVAQTDLISYSSPFSVEQERSRLELARAHARVRLRKYFEGATTPPAFLQGQSYPDVYECAVNARIDDLSGMVAENDKNFTRFRRSTALKASLRGLAVGLVAGEVLHEVGAVSQGHMTHIEYLHRYMDKNLPDVHNGTVPVMIDKETTVSLPQGYDMVKDPNGTFSLFDPDHTQIARGLHFEHGQLSPDSVTALHEGGIGTVPTHHSVVDHTETHTHEVGPKEYVKAHSEEFERIKRGEWLDNNTRRPDKNELRLDFRKSGNSIIGDIHRMYPGGSYTKNIHVDPQELIKHHKVSLQFCLSRDTQNWVMRIPVGVDGRVHIDPNSELGKTFFALDKDKMHYLFKYAEAVYQSGTKDGKPVYDMLATEVGPGKASHIIHSVETIYRSITNTKIDIPAQYHVDPPYIIPYFWRDPLEPTTVPPPEAPPQPYGPYEYGKPGEGEKRRVQVRTLSEMFPNDEYLIAAAGAITSGPNPIPNPSQIPTQQSAQQKNPSLSQGPNIPHYAPIIESHGETRPDNDLEERDGFTIVDKRSTATTEHQNKQTVPYQYGAGAVSQTMQEQLPNDDSILGAAKGVNQSQSFISSPDQEMNAKDAQIRGENRRLEEMIQYARSAFQNDPSPDNRMLLQNLLIERASIGERFLPEQFYDKSPVVQGLDNAKEIIIVLKTAIGDAVLTSSLIDVAAQYCSLRNTGAKIIVKTAQREVIKGYEIRYPGMVKVEDFNQNETIESTDDRYIINGSSDRSPIIVGTDMNNPRRILNVDHYSFQMQEYGVPSTFPENQDKTDKHHYSFRRKIGTYPGMVARNFELLTGVKLFDDLEDQKFILPPPDGNETPTKTNELKGKYGIGVDEEYLLFAVQSSVRPKMLMPSKWAQVLTGLQSEIVDKNRKVVFIRPPDTAYATELDRELSLLPESLRNRIVWVREPLGAIADLTTGAKATISVDTGIGHISASLGTPTLMMYSSGNPLFWSAPNQPLRRLYTEHAGDMLRNNVDVYSKAWDHTDSYYTDDGVGLDAIPPERIIAKTLSMLEK